MGECAGWQDFENGRDGSQELFERTGNALSGAHRLSLSGLCGIAGGAQDSHEIACPIAAISAEYNHLKIFQFVVDKLCRCRGIDFFSYTRIHIGHYSIASFSFSGSIANSSNGCHSFLVQIAASFSLIVSAKTMTFLSGHDMTISPSNRLCFTAVDK